MLSVCLCDTTGAEDVHINDILVQQGHARFLDSYEGGSVKSERSKTPDPSPTLSPSSTTSSISDIKVNTMYTGRSCEFNEQEEDTSLLYSDFFFIPAASFGAGSMMSPWMSVVLLLSETIGGCLSSCMDTSILNPKLPNLLTYICDPNSSFPEHVLFCGL